MPRSINYVIKYKRRNEYEALHNAANSFFISITFGIPLIEFELGLSKPGRGIPFLLLYPGHILNSLKNFLKTFSVDRNIV